VSRQRVSAIILKNEEILLLHRFRQGKEYYTTPGGGVEDGESIKEALVREVKEETNFDDIHSSLLWEYTNEDYGRDRGTKPQLEYYFLVDSYTGELKLGGPEIERNSPDNSYALEWVPLHQVPQINLIPEPIKEKILKELL